MNFNDLLMSLQDNKIFLNINTNEYEQKTELHKEEEYDRINLIDKFKKKERVSHETKFKNNFIKKEKKTSFLYEKSCDKIRNKFLLNIKICLDPSLLLHEDCILLETILDDFEKQVVQKIIEDEIHIKVIRTGRKALKMKIIDCINNKTIDKNLDEEVLKYLSALYNTGIIIVNKNTYSGSLKDSNIVMKNETMKIIKRNDNIILTQEDVEKFSKENNLIKKPEMNVLRKMKITELKQYCDDNKIDFLGLKKTELLKKLENLQ